jgi:4-hydroxy-2-oxoheptanedioate aldolase
MNSGSLRKPRRKDEASWGIHLSFLCPELIEFCGLMGFEWLFLDTEHQPLSHQACRDLVRAADGVGMFCMVRVPEIKASIIEGYLDVGVLGILAPNVSSADEARALVASVKFTPEGQRGAASKGRAANYGLTQTAADYCRQANQRTFTVALIESQSGIDHLEDIMAVPGLDYLAIGPNDLGLSMGIDEGMVDARVRSIVEGAQARIKAAGKPQLAVVSDVDQARKSVTAGATLIAIPDAALFASAGRTFLEMVNA